MAAASSALEPCSGSRWLAGIPHPLLDVCEQLKDGVLRNNQLCVDGFEEHIGCQLALRHCVEKLLRPLAARELAEASTGRWIEVLPHVPVEPVKVCHDDVVAALLAERLAEGLHVRHVVGILHGRTRAARQDQHKGEGGAATPD